MRNKRDRARISREIHEIAYCRKLAKGLINDLEWSRIHKESGNSARIRVCKAFLKFTKGYTKSPNGRRYKK